MPDVRDPPQARKALDAANAKLRQLRGGGTASAAKATDRGDSWAGAAASGVDPKAVRAWAAANGVECGPIGRVPRPVVEQYLAAQKEVA